MVAFVKERLQKDASSEEIAKKFHFECGIIRESFLNFVSTLPPKESSASKRPKPVNEKAVKRIEELQQRLNSLADRIKAKGFNAMSDKIADKMLTLKELNPDIATDALLRSLKKDLDDMEQELRDEVEVIADERKEHSLINIEGVAKVKAAATIEASQLSAVSHTVPLDREEHQIEITRLLEGLLSPVENKNDEQAVVTVRILLKLCSIQQALEHVSCLISNLKTKTGLIDLSEKMFFLKKILDDPLCLLLVNEVLLDLRRDQGDEVPQKLTGLLMRLKEERLYALASLSQIQELSIEKLCSFVHLFGISVELNVGQVWQRMQQLKELQFQFTQLMKSAAPEKDLVLKQSSTELFDFVAAFCPGNDEDCESLLLQCLNAEDSVARKLDMKKLEAAFSAGFRCQDEHGSAVPLATERFLGALRDHFVETVSCVHALKEEVDSPSTEIFRNLNFLAFIFRQWNNVSEIVYALNSVEVDQRMELLLGENFIDFKSRIAKKKEELKYAQKELAEFSRSHPELMKFTLESFITGSESSESCNNASKSSIDTIQELEKSVQDIERSISELIVERDKKVLNEWETLKYETKSVGEGFNTIISRIIVVLAAAFKDKEQSEDSSSCFEEWLKRRRAEILRLNDYQNESRKQTIARCCMEIFELKTKVVDLVRIKIEKLQRILGANSPLFNHFQRLIIFSGCVVSSLSWSLESLVTVLENESHEKTQLAQRFLLIQREVALYAENVLSAEAVARGGGSLTTEEMNELISHMNAIDKCIDRLSLDVFNITVAHAKNFIARLVMFCLSNAENMLVSREKTDHVLEVLGLPSLPRGDAQLSSLLNRLVIEYKTMPGLRKDNALVTGVTSGTCVSLLTLLDALQVIDKHFGTLGQGPPLMLKVKDLTKKKDDDSLLDLLNISMLCNAVTERVINLTTAFKATTSDRLTGDEMEALKSVETSLKRIMKVCGEERFSHLNPLRLLADKLSEMTKEIFNGHYGCTEVHDNIRQLQYQIQTLRPKMKSYMTELAEISQKLSASLAALTLDHDLWKMGRSLQCDASVTADKDQLLYDYLETRQNTSTNRFLPLAMLAGFCFIGMQEIIALSCKTFETYHAFEDCRARFEKTIIPASNLISKIGELLNTPRLRIEALEQESVKFEDMRGVREIQEAARMPQEEKCQWKLVKASSTIIQTFDDILRLKEVLSDLMRLPTEWDQAFSALMTWRKKIGKEMSLSFEEQREQIMKDNEEKRNKFERDSESFHVAVKKAKTVYSDAKESLLLCFLKLSDEQRRHSNVDKEKEEFKGIIKDFMEAYDRMAPHVEQIDDPLDDSFELERVSLYLSLKCIQVLLWCPFTNLLGIVTYGNQSHKWYGKRGRFQTKVFMDNNFFRFHLCKKVEVFEVEVHGLDGYVDEQIPLLQMSVPVTYLKKGYDEKEFVFPKCEPSSVTFEYNLNVEMKPKVSALYNIKDYTKKRHKFIDLLTQLSKCRQLVRALRNDAEKVSHGPPEPPDIRYVPSSLDDSMPVPKIPLHESMSNELTLHVVKVEAVVETLEARTRQLQEVLDIVRSGEMSMDLSPEVKDLAQKIEAELPLLNSMREINQQTQLLIDQLLKEKTDLKNSGHCVKNDGDLIHYPFFILKKLRPIEAIYTPSEMEQVRKCIKYLNQTNALFDVISAEVSDALVYALKFFVILSLESDEASNLSLQFIERGKRLMPQSGHFDILHNETQEIRNRKKELNQKIKASITWTPNCSDLRFSNAKFVPQRLVTMEARTSDKEHQLTCSHREVDIDLGVFVRNLPVNEPTDHHIKVLCENFICKYKMTEVSGDEAVLVRPTNEGFANNGEVFECKFLPDVEAYTVGAHKVVFILKMSDTSTAKSCEVLVQVNFLIEEFQKTDLFPNLPRKEETSLLDLGKVRMNSKLSKSVVVKNPLSVPMRLKFFPENDDVITVKKELILAPHQQRELALTLNVASNNGEFSISVHVYYSANSYHVLAIDYLPCRWNVKIFNRQEKVNPPVLKVFDNIAANSRITWNGLRIRNLGTLPVRLKNVRVTESPAGEIEVPEGEIVESSDLVVPVHIYPKEAGEWKLSSILALSAPHERSDFEIEVTVFVKSHWAKLTLSRLYVCIVPKDLKTQIKRDLTIENDSQVVTRIYTLLIDDPLLITPQLQEMNFPLIVQGKGKLKIPITINPCLRGAQFMNASNVTVETNCQEKFKTLSFSCWTSFPEIELTEEVFDVGSLRKEPEKVKLLASNSGLFASVKVEGHSSVPDVSVSKKYFILGKDMTEEITCTISLSDRVPANGSTFFHSRIVFKSLEHEDRPFAAKTAWILGNVERGDAPAVETTLEHLSTLDRTALCNLMMAVKMAKTCDSVTVLAALAFAALLNDEQTPFGQTVGAILVGETPANLADLYQAATKRNPTAEELEFLASPENMKKIIPNVIEVFNELARTKEGGLLFRNALYVRYDFRWKNGANICHLLDGMEGAMRVCQSFVQKKDPETSQKIAALASAIRTAEIQPVQDNLKVFCALALCLKSKFFEDPCAFSVGVILEYCIQAAKDKSFRYENLFRIIAARQGMLGRQFSYRGKSVTDSLQMIEKVLMKPPNWKPNPEASSSLNKVSEAVVDLMDALSPEPNAKESRITEALCLALSPDPVTASLGCVSLCTFSIHEASCDVTPVQPVTEVGEDESSFAAAIERSAKPGSVPKEDIHHRQCIIMKDEERGISDESNLRREGAYEYVKGSSGEHGSESEEDLNDSISGNSLPNSQPSEAQIKEIEDIVTDTLLEIDEHFETVISAFKEINAVGRIHLDSLLSLLSNGSKIVEPLQRVVGVIFQKTTWNNLSQELPDSVLHRIVTMCGRLHQILQVFESEWKKKEVKGKFNDRFFHLKSQTVVALDVVLESMVNGGEQLREELKDAGLNLKLKNVADDFDVKISPSNLLHPCKSIRERNRPACEIANFKNFDVKGHIVVKEKERKYFTDGVDPVAWMEGGNSEVPLGLRQCKLVSDRHNVLQIDAHSSMHDVHHECRTRMPNTLPICFSAKYVRSAQNTKFVEHSLEKRRIQLTAEQIKMMRRKCKNQLEDLETFDAVHDVAKYRDPEELPQVEQEELKYLLLARITRGLQSKTLSILTRARDESGRKRAEVSLKQEIKFVFLVDNSGSMFGEKMTLALTLLVVLLESMKRLEFATAVVRFGGEESQTILKSFLDGMDNKRGQYILESFDATEKTLAADAVKFVASDDALYGATPDRNEHRFIVLITDGIWSQSQKGAYEMFLTRSKASMMVLTTNPSKDKDLELYNLSVGRAKKILDSISPRAWFGIDAEEDLSEQIGPVATIFDRKIREVLLRASASDDSSAETNFEIGNLSMALVPPDPPVTSTLQYSTPGVIEWGTSVYASNLQTSQAVQTVDDNLNTAIWEKVCQTRETFARRDISTDDSELAVDSRAKIITRKQNEWTHFISDLCCVLDTSVLPNNRPTRAMQDYHGPTFSLRGFIRFICTDGQYKKIYENVIGHPRKDYCVSVILDTSTSMCGMTAVGSIEAFIGLSAALHECGVSFGLLTAGVETRLIKDLSEEWGPVAKARAHAAIKFEDRESNIADAILFASHLVQQGASSKTVKIVFVITDGFDSAPMRLRQSLKVAEAQDVMVIGIGIGYFTEAIFDFFPHYVVVNNPELLPLGLHRLFAGEGSSERPLREFVEEDKQVELRGRVLSTVQEVWDQEMRDVYKKVVERNRAALYLAVAPIRQKCDRLSMDVCFVMDTTGSMSSHIRNAQRYVVTMANDIKANVSKSGKAADLRMAFVSYKFFDDSDHLDDHHPFSDNIDSVMEVVNRMRASGGSDGNGYEDKFGGLNVALSFDWRAAAKFLVLIGDFPDHSLYCSTCEFCQDERQSRCSGGMLELVQQMARQKIHLLYVRITHRTRDEEVRVEDTYRNAAPADMKAKGFTLLDITSPGAAENLMSDIAELIDQIIAEEFL